MDDKTVINLDFASLYPTTMRDFSGRFQQEIIRLQRDENIDSILEGREPKEITYNISSRCSVNDDGYVELLGFDIIRPNEE